MRIRACLLLLCVGGLTACETVVDPSTGQSQTRWTPLLTAANADRAEAQWRQCVQFRSESYCARNLPGGRPPGLSQSSTIGYQELIERDNDP